MYTIHKVDAPITDIFSAAWDKAELAEVNCLNWPDRWDYNPGMQARIVYSEVGLHVKLTTQEQPLLARATSQNGDIYKDSCMEFFFRPKAEDPRYLNFEFNAFGSMYLGLRTGRNDPSFPTEDKRYFGVTSDVTDKEWNLMFTVPFAFIEKYFGGYDKTMYGNLYKCGDETVREHYVTYYPMPIDPPDYHKPECFGEFVLD